MATPSSRHRPHAPVPMAVVRVQVVQVHCPECGEVATRGDSDQVGIHEHDGGVPWGKAVPCESCGQIVRLPRNPFRR